MAIPLGRSLGGSPVYVLLQIAYGCSLFFLILGAVRVIMIIVLGQEAMASSESPPPSNNSSKTPLSTSVVDQVSNRVPLNVPQACSFLPLDALFSSPVRVRVSRNLLDPVLMYGTAGQFLCMHLLSAAVMAFPLSRALQRRKFVPDFVLTIYGVYLLLADIALRQFFGDGTLRWWGTVLFSLGVMYALTWWLCGRREMQEIILGGDGSGAISADGGGGAGAESVEMVCVREDAEGDGTQDADSHRPFLAKSASPAPPKHFELAGSSTEVAMANVTAPGSASKMRKKEK